MKSKQLQLTILVGEIVPGSFIAMTSVGGIVVRSGRATNEVDAIRSLGQQLSSSEAEFGIALALEGTNLQSMESELRALSEPTD